MQCGVKCGVVRLNVAYIWYDLEDVALCGMQCEMGCNARCGRVMHIVADMVRLI